MKFQDGRARRPWALGTILIDRLAWRVLNGKSIHMISRKGTAQGFMWCKCSFRMRSRVLTRCLKMGASWST